MPSRKASYSSNFAGVMKGMEVFWPGACILESISWGRVSWTLWVRLGQYRFEKSRG